MPTFLRPFPYFQFLAAFLALFSLSYGIASSEQSKALPEYVTNQYGHPPKIPKGPYPPDIKSAVNVAFVDALDQPKWGSDQSNALREIAESKDPRIVWIISDLMRFASSRELY